MIALPKAVLTVPLALGMHFPVPRPRGPGDRRKVGMFGRKPQARGGELGVGDEASRITGTAQTLDAGRGLVTLGADGVEHLFDGTAAPGTEIAYGAGIARHQALHGRHMRIGLDRRRGYNRESRCRQACRSRRRTLGNP